MINYWKIEKIKKKRFTIDKDVDHECSQECIDLIKYFEGFKKEAYPDTGGVWTIGYGTTRYSKFKRVKKGDVVTKTQAEAYLKEDVARFVKAVNKRVTVPLEQHQFDALVCWTYNLGETNLRKSTMLKVLNKGLYDQVPNQMRRWNKDNGKVIRGLVRRRHAEATLFESGISIRG